MNTLRTIVSITIRNGKKLSNTLAPIEERIHVNLGLRQVADGETATVRLPPADWSDPRVL